MKTISTYMGYCSGQAQNLLIIFTFVLVYNNVFAQIGVGAEANISYPGVFRSDENNVRFKTGTGYGFFVRHDVYKSENWQAHLRYRANISNHKANLPFEKDSDYKFSNFGLEALISFAVSPQSSVYGGTSINLLSLSVKNKYYKNFNSEKILPSILVGYSYIWAEGFDLYLELSSRFGSVDAGPGSESLPVTSIGLNVGFTMYISE
jgi:hypothetical protein